MITYNIAPDQENKDEDDKEVIVNITTSNTFRVTVRELKNEIIDLDIEESYIRNKKESIDQELETILGE